MAEFAAVADGESDEEDPLDVRPLKCPWIETQ